jgi:RNase H-fold protein (predicted Holliday junction resolvase)
MNTFILSIDPGKEKYGVALLDHAGCVLTHTILSLEKLSETIADLVKKYPQLKMVIGNSTGRNQVLQIARQMHLEYEIVDESHSTEEARKLYFEAHPPRWLKKILPLSMLVPPVAYDDWSAVVIGRRYLVKLHSEGDVNE